MAGAFLNPQPEILTLAGIHATVLSIIIAAISAYGFYLFGVLDALEREVTEEANRVNSISFSYDSWTDESASLKLQENRYKLHKRFERVAGGGPIEETSENFTHWPDHKRGDELITIMRKMAADYPFPTRLRNATDQPVKFSSAEDVREWLDASQKLLLTLRSVLGREPEREKFKNLLRAYSRHEGQVSGMEQREIHPAAEEFIEKAGELGQIANAVRLKFDRFELFKERRKSEKRPLLTGIILAGIAFMCGVILPMLWPQVSSGFALWAPLAYYAVAFFYVIYRVALIPA